MHHCECVAPNVDIILQSGWFWATSIASFRERFNDSRSCWVVFIHIVRERPSGLLQFSKGEAVKICLASDSSGIHTGQNWVGTDRPQPISTWFASVYQFCFASLWEDHECRPEELENRLDWCRHDKGDQRKTGAVNGYYQSITQLVVFLCQFKEMNRRCD